MTALAISVGALAACQPADESEDQTLDEGAATTAESGSGSSVVVE